MSEQNWLSIADRIEQEQVCYKHLFGRKVIVRTDRAGVFFGDLETKAGREILLKNAIRLWYWSNIAKGLALSDSAIHGLSGESKVCEPVDLIWLEAIEIIPCTDEAIKRIESLVPYRAD